MKILKKVLALLSAGTMLIGGAATAMTASADASRGAPDQHIALRLWTQILAENGIDFNEFGASHEDNKRLEAALKEKGISASDFCSSTIYGVKEFTKLLAENGMDDGEINMTFVMYMLGLKALINDPCSRSYDCQPGIPENEAKIQKLLDQGYTWSDENGWEFDLDEYLRAKGKLDSYIDVLENEKVLGDINGDGIFNISDIVTLQKALSTSTATPDMDINGDGKVNAFDLVAAKRMLSDSLGADVKPI